MMDEAMVKKFRLPIITAGVMAVIGFVIVIAILTVLRDNGRLQRQAAELETAIKADTRAYGADPEAALVRQSVILNELSGRYADLKNKFMPGNSVSEEPLSPLSFKQRLFTVCDALQKRAQQAAVPVPESLGFSDYALNVPEPALIPVLSRELAMVEEVVTLLLESKADAIDSLTLKHKATIMTRPVSDTEKISLPATELNVVFEADYPRIQKFLMGLNRSPNIYIIRHLELKRKETLSARLIATVELESVIWE